MTVDGARDGALPIHLHLLYLSENEPPNQERMVIFAETCPAECQLPCWEARAIFPEHCPAGYAGLEAEAKKLRPELSPAGFESRSVGKLTDHVWILPPDFEAAYGEGETV